MMLGRNIIKMRKIILYAPNSNSVDEICDKLGKFIATNDYEIYIDGDISTPQPLFFEFFPETKKLIISAAGPQIPYCWDVEKDMFIAVRG